MGHPIRILAVMLVGVLFLSLWCAGPLWTPATEPYLASGPRGPSQTEVPSGEIAAAPRGLLSPGGGGLPARRSPPDRLQLLLGFEDGTPLGERLVAVLVENAVFQRGTTDAEGRLELPGTPSPVEVLVFSRSAVIGSFSLEEGLGAHSLVLPDRTLFSGWVLMDGRSPEESFSFSLKLDGESGGIRLPPAAVRRAFDWRGLGPHPVLRVRTTSTGRFIVRGLDPGWSGTIRLDFGTTFEGGGETLNVGGADDGGVLRLVSGPAIVGRLVDPTGAAVPAAECFYSLVCGGGASEGSVLTRDTGSFRIPLGCLPVQSGELSFVVIGTGGAHVDLPRIEESGYATGDILLREADSFSVRVLSSSGGPIRGARVAWSGDSSGLVFPTDAEGIAVLVGRDSMAPSFEIEALGYEPYQGVSIPVSGTLDEPFPVRLPSLANLEVAVHHRDGSPCTDVFVELSSQEAAPFWIGAERSSDPPQTDIGAPSPENITRPDTGPASPERVRMLYRVDSSGTLRVPGLWPGGRLTLRVEDVLRNVVVERGVSLETSQGTTRAAFTLPRGRSIRLRVLDRGGVAIPGVVLGREDGNGVVGRTDQRGEARIGPLYAEGIGLFLSKPGFSPLSLDDVRFRDGSALEVVLDGPRVVSLRAATSDGAAANPDFVICRLGRYSVGSPRRREDGVWGLEEMPIDPFQVFVRFAGRWFQEEVHVGEEDVRFEFPPTGSLTIKFGSGWGSAPGESETRVLRAVSLEDPETSLQWTVSREQEELRIPDLFPGSYSVFWVGAEEETPRGAGLAKRIEVEAGRETTVVL